MRWQSCRMIIALASNLFYSSSYHCYWKIFSKTYISCVNHKIVHPNRNFTLTSFLTIHALPQIVYGTIILFILMKHLHNMLIEIFHMLCLVDLSRQTQIIELKNFIRLFMKSFLSWTLSELAVTMCPGVPRMLNRSQPSIHYYFQIRIIIFK